MHFVCSISTLIFCTRSEDVLFRCDAGIFRIFFFFFLGPAVHSMLICIMLQEGKLAQVSAAGTVLSVRDNKKNKPEINFPLAAIFICFFVTIFSVLLSFRNECF